MNGYLPDILYEIFLCIPVRTYYGAKKMKFFVAWDTSDGVLHKHQAYQAVTGQGLAWNPRITYREYLSISPVC
jgi:hypothetical protein